MKLQKFNINESQYERPNQKWICGKIRFGMTCPNGPTKSGKCCASSECIPIKKGDRWYCKRDSGHGGICARGPTPEGKCCNTIPRCNPTRSLRSKRNLFLFWSFLVVAGVILILIGGKERETYISPGNLSSNHNTHLNDCAKCHTNATINPADWFSTAFSSKDHLEDSRLCVKCHNMGENTFSPHSINVKRLAIATEKFERHNLAKNLSPIDSVINTLTKHQSHNNEQLACNNCHKEHQGLNHNIAEMSNQRCQTCHVSRFNNFANQHPDFDQYPYMRRTRIIFDHSSHILDHFTKDSVLNAPNNCSACHSPDPMGNKMLVKGFKDMCSRCHDGQIRGQGQIAKGIDFITIPGIDLDTLNEKNVNIGEWPEDADGELTDFTRLILSADVETRVNLETISSLDLYDLTTATPTELNSVKHVLISLKSLLNNIVHLGQEAIISTLSNDSDQENDSEILHGLMIGLQRDTIKQLQLELFPNLDIEMNRLRLGKPIGIIHHVDSKLGKIIPATNSTDVDKTGPMSSDEIIGDNDILSDDDILDGDDDILSDDSIFADDENIFNDDDNLDEIEFDVDDDKDQFPIEIKTKSAEDWVENGGWYKTDYSINYRPSGHSDEFLKSWINYSCRLKKSNTKAKKLFHSLTGKKSVGLCMKCHSIDANDQGRTQVNWKSLKPIKLIKTFTKFSHLAHNFTNESKSCQVCHELKNQSKFIVFFDQLDPYKFESNFRHLSKQKCATCHTPKAAGDSCLKCHNYHINKLSLDHIDSTF